MRIAPPDVLAPRLERLHAALAGRTLDARIVTTLPNIAYLSGLFASAGILVVTAERLIDVPAPDVRNAGKTMRAVTGGVRPSTENAA